MGVGVWINYLDFSKEVIDGVNLATTDLDYAAEQALGRELYDRGIDLNEVYKIVIIADDDIEAIRATNEGRPDCDKRWLADYSPSYGDWTFYDIDDRFESDTFYYE